MYVKVYSVNNIMQDIAYRFIHKWRSATMWGTIASRIFNNVYILGILSNYNLYTPTCFKKDKLQNIKNYSAAAKVFIKKQ